MSVYLVAQVNIHDRATYATYVSAVGEILALYDGKILSVEDAPTLLEGRWDYVRTVLLEFPSEDRAHAWYYSKEYQAIAEYRRAASTANLVFIRGR